MSLFWFRNCYKSNVAYNMLNMDHVQCSIVCQLSLLYVIAQKCLQSLFSAKEQHFHTKTFLHCIIFACGATEYCLLSCYRSSNCDNTVVIQNKSNQLCCLSERSDVLFLSLSAKHRPDMYKLMYAEENRQLFPLSVFSCIVT